MNLKLNSASAQHPAAQYSGKLALQGIDLSVQEGEQLAVIGPSGSGKTTLLHLLSCALKISAGSYEIDSEPVDAFNAQKLRIFRKQLFLAPQVPPLPPRQRVVTSVLAGRLPQMSLLGSLKSLFYPTLIQAAHAALAHFDVQDKLFERVDQLSGGERQRVGLARLAASNAKLLLVDEPLSALDPSRAVQAMTSLIKIARERQATLICTLHHVEMALAHFPRIIGLREGHLFFDLPAQAVTQELLQKLYAQHLDELTGSGASAAPEPEGLKSAILPAVMHCR